MHRPTYKQLYLFAMYSPSCMVSMPAVCGTLDNFDSDVAQRYSQTRIYQNPYGDIRAAAECLYI